MDQGLPEAKRAKTVSTDRTAADHEATTHHRTTSTKTTSNLLIRLSQGCLRHQQTCHSNDESMAQGEGAEAQQCASEMQKLSRLIPRIEASCLNAIHISPAEIQNLALFYVSVVQRTYCPYSLLYIFNDGKGAVEVLPRVHQLLHHVLHTDAMVQDTIQSMVKRHQNRSATSNTTTKSGKSNAASDSPISCDECVPNAVEDVARACAVLLECILEPNLQSLTFSDVIFLWQDTNTLLSSYCASLTCFHAYNNIDITIFTQTIQSNPTLNNDKDREYVLHVPSIEALLMLQHCTIQILLTMIADMICTEDVHISFKCPLEHINCQHLLDCIHQMMLITFVPNKESLLTSSRNSNFELLLQRNKTLSLLLLRVLIPELMHNCSSQSTLCHDVTNIVTDSVLQHSQSYREYSTMNSNDDTIFKHEHNVISSILTNLLRDTYMNSSIRLNDKINLQVCHVYTLLDCLPHTSGLFIHDGSFKILIRTILLCIYTCIRSLSISDTTQSHNLDAQKHIIRSISDYCVIESIWNSLFSLVDSTAYTNIILMIVICMWGDGNEYLQQYDSRHYFLGNDHIHNTMMECLEELNRKAFEDSNERQFYYVFISISLYEGILKKYEREGCNHIASIERILSKLYTLCIQALKDKILFEHITFVLMMLLLKRNFHHFPSDLEKQRSALKYGIIQNSKKILQMVTSETKDSSESPLNISTMQREEYHFSFPESVERMIIFDASSKQTNTTNDLFHIAHSEVQTIMQRSMRFKKMYPEHHLKHDESIFVLEDTMNTTEICIFMAMQCSKILQYSVNDMLLQFRTNRSFSFFIKCLPLVIISNSIFETQSPMDTYPEMFLKAVIRNIESFFCLENIFDLICETCESDSNVLFSTIQSMSTIMQIYFVAEHRLSVQSYYSTDDCTDSCLLSVFYIIERFLTDFGSAHQHYTIKRPPYSDQCCNFIQSILNMSYSKIFTAHEHTTEAFWILSLVFFASLSQKELNTFNLSSMKLNDSKNSVNPQTDNRYLRTISGKSMHIIEWIFVHPFCNTICEETMNRFATILASFIFAENIQLLLTLCHGKDSDSPLDSARLCSSDESMLDLILSFVDEMSSTYCGISDGSISFTFTATQYLGTFDSIHSIDDNVVSKHCSSQIFIIQLLFSLCQNIPDEFKQRSVLIEKGVMYIFRLWIISAIAISSEKNLSSNRLCHHDVEKSAIEQLASLRKHDIIGPDTIRNFDNSFVPGLFCEILFRSHDTIGGSGMSTICFNLLTHFLRDFIVSKPFSFSENVAFEDYDCSVFETLKSFDKILPLVIAGLVLEQDYDSLCKCTNFRLLLLSKLKLMDRKMKTTKSCTLNLLGSHMSKKRFAPGNILISSEDLSRQTSKLCVLEDPNQPILSEILKQLLLIQEKAPFIFFQKKVIQSKVSLSTLLRKTEFAVLEGMIWILGQFEMNNDQDSFHDKSWNSMYCNQAAFQALKKGSLLLTRPCDTLDNYENSQSQVVVSDFAGKTNSCATTTPEDLVDQWIQKHFMGLLVSVTTKWKRGRLETKVSAMGALRVLVRFLDKEDASQYITHVLGIVDGSMHISFVGKEDRSFGVFYLHDLAIKTLSHFVRTLLLLQNKEIVGKNLCNIIVSIYPLFREQLDTISSSNPETRPMLESIRQNAVEIIEYLVDGTIGQDLIPFFRQVPFLPSDPKFHHVRDALKRNGLNFDSILLVGTQTQCDGTPIDRSDTEEDRSFSSEEAKLQTALSCRLNALSILLGHENENVRKICIKHIIEIVLRHHSLFLKLVEVEDASNKFLTVQKDNETVLVESGSMNRFVKTVLKRCAVESNVEILVLLAKCLGVLGPIDPMLITDDFETKENDHENDDLIWIRKKAPWTFQSLRQQVGLQLLKKHFVVALKAASTPTDQHKIAFAIQEVLKHLDGEILRSKESSALNECNGNGREMSHWLREQLESSGVLSIIEPYWKSLYKQNEASKSKMPPFFSGAKTYYIWLSDWGRFMIERSANNQKSIYRELFFATRSALRSEVGLVVIEFLFPYLILDAICFGDELDKRTVLNELTSPLTAFSNNYMPLLELQKSISIVFSTIKVFQWWSENEIEAQRVDRSSSSVCTNDISDQHQWPTEISLVQISELLDNISLDACSQAAEFVGMFAQSVYFLEVGSRKKEAQIMDAFATCTKPITQNNNRIDTQNKHCVSAMHTLSMNLGRAHRLFSELDDQYSMAGIANCRSDTTIMDQILEKKACNDWDSVLRLCELSSQLGDRSSKSNVQNIRQLKAVSMLKLGQIESALDFAFSVMNNPSSVDEEANPKSIEENATLVPCAIEASWRLGRWDLLQTIIFSNAAKSVNHGLNTSDFESRYNFHLGCAMLSLREHDTQSLYASIREGREAIIPCLSVVANENYPRALPYLTKLQILQEIERASRLLSDNKDVPIYSEDYLKQSLGSVHPQISISMDSIAVRLAISSIISDKNLQTSLWLTAGKLARKDGLYQIAESYLSHAYSIYQETRSNLNYESNVVHCELYGSEIKLQMAKVKHSNGETTAAIRMLTSQAFEELILNSDDKELSKAIKKLSAENRLLEIGRTGLQSTQWLVESGLKSGSDAIRRYKVLTMLLPDWERAHHKFAKYLDSVAASRINVLTLQNGANPDDDESRGHIIRKDRICQKYILEAINQYGEALSKSQKHVFQGLPRLLTLWFDLNALQSDEVIGLNQDKANELMVTFMKKIPSISYYSVLSQLVSRIGHKDDDVVNILCAILKRILIKFPAQAMWQLGWLRHSIYSDRKKKGEDIFKGAQKGLQKVGDLRMHDLLEGSKDLFEFLINLAKYKPKRQDQKSLQIMSWKGKVELKEFLPPVQAALTVSRTTMGPSSNRYAFPRNVPRIRAFSSNVPMMSSKAKPKKLTAFAIPEYSQKAFEQSSRYNSTTQSGDIGEMHFLVKQEAKGDLRKDARVQDLNNVINRLFTQSASANKSKKWNHRRLKLRTFAVTCLSEDCGILEWVPNTESFRNLVGSSYNPYESSRSEKRRGKRIINFSDASLRNTFAKCQDQYLKLGNLTKAATMFDELMLQEYPPLFYWWFVREFQDPHAWFEARTRFALSAAAWSAVGHIIGLGDRHSENILIETSTGECVHVDFDCIFNKGLLLPRPEVIPFRLTPNMIDAFGPTGADGAFSGALRSAMTTLRDNKDILLSVLEPFLKDPVIDWKRQRTQQSSNSEQSSREENEAKRSISVIDERLRGMYNLRNPNFKKIKRVDVPSMNEDDEMARLLPLSVEGQVHKMISEATSHENLVQIYVGWMPWL